MKGEAIDRTVWRSRFGGGCGTFIRQTSEWMACDTPKPDLFKTWNLV